MGNSLPRVTGDRLRLDTFARLVAENRIRDARILDQDSYVVGQYVRNDGTAGRYNLPYLQDASRERLVDLLLDSRVPTEIAPQFSKRLLGPATFLLPALIVVVVFGYLVLSQQQGTGLFGIRSGARRVSADQAGATFADVAGQDGAIAELREIKDFLADPGRFAALGAVVPKGVLLFGPPGCGKTLLARAVAGEAGAAFFSVSGSDFVELYVGVGAARVRDLFNEARRHAPAIVFIDELDSVGRRRASGGAGAGSRDEQEQALNQILAELDGFSPLQGIIVIGATNRPDVLDPALLRPGRFDRSIGLERPNREARLAILGVHATNKALEAGVDLAGLADRAIGLSGADLANVMNEGALLAARADRSVISPTDLEAGLGRILEAPERQRRLSQRDNSFGRFAASGHRVTFADVAGVEGAVEELREVCSYLADPDDFVDLGARPPAAVLLAGPPGSGKTLLARAVAGEANAAFFPVAATEFLRAFAGEGAARVRDLFAEARAAAPAIVFVDEIDAVGARRIAGADGQRERDHTLNQILIELDGFEPRSAVMVLAATNRPELLDEALLRPGRFDRIITLGLPDRAARRAILALHARNKVLAPDVDLEALSALTQGFSGAELAGLLNEAALLAGRERLAQIPVDLVERALQRAMLGVTQPRTLAGLDRAVVAYHEAGHGLVGLALPGAERPRSLSIVAQGDVLGVTRQGDEIDRLVYGRSLLIDRMAGALGGRAAEEIVFGEPGSGSADDLVRVTALARRMVCELGMSESLGPLTYSSNGSGQSHSEESAREIDVECRRLVSEAHSRARSVLVECRSALDAVAMALMEREDLSAEEMAEIASGREPQFAPKVVDRLESDRRAWPLCKPSLLAVERNE
ncbi:MAG: AAA family ATPase [Acidimicrobiales bacterium]